MIHLTLTGAGVDLLREAPPPLQDRFVEGLNALDEAEQATIATALERLVQLMEAKEVEAAPILETSPMEASTEEQPHANPPPTMRKLPANE